MTTLEEELRAVPGTEPPPVAPAAALVNACKTFRSGSQDVHALRALALEVEAGSFVAVTGPSGAGKTTMLQVLGGVERLDSGTVTVGGKELGAFDDAGVTVFRRRHIGFVFQFFNLLPTLTAWENVAVPLTLDGVRRADARDQAAELLDTMGLGDRIGHRPSELSGGEMQRVAIARALVTNPMLVLADEPTGNLDSDTGREVLHVLRQVVDRGRTVVMVTHSDQAARTADRVIRLVDGAIAPS